MFYDIYVLLCKDIGKKPSAVAQELGINKSNVTNWKNNGCTPRGATLTKIADYFGVSTDFLLGNEINDSASEQNHVVIEIPDNYKKNAPLSPNKGERLIIQALKDTGLLDQNGELSEEGGKIIAKFLRDNTDTLKIMLQLSKQEEK